MAGFWDRLMRRGQIIGMQSSDTPGAAPVLVHWLDVTPRDRDEKPCALESLEVKARVRGVFAEVTQTLVLSNPNPRPLSASIAIPLPDRATVNGYALDINNTMVDGVVVPKEQARVAFETEQRRGADPGLVEAVRGNAYRTRVYPVPARGQRTVRLRYVSPLLLGANDSATLDLPMPAEHLDRRSIHVSVERLGDVAPRITGLAGADLLQTETAWGVETEERNLTPTEPVRIELPSLPREFALTERDEEGAVWFCASAVAPRPVVQDIPSLKKLTVLWDASGSRGMQDHQQELELLRAYANAGTVEEIALVTFADHVLESQSFAGSKELVKHIAHLHYDGGTNFSELAETLAEAPASHAQDGAACVLFTDGLDTLCDEALAFPGSHDILAIVSGQERDAEAMRQACRGLAFEISQAPQNASELMAAFANRGRHGLWHLAGTGVADVFDVSSPNGERLVALGRLTGEETTLALGEGLQPVNLLAGGAQKGTMLASAWASRRVALLAPRASENASELLQLGRRFGVVSPATSLLVLESLDQWLKYDIEPPRTLTSIHDEWTRRKRGAMRISSDEANKVAHRSNLAREWAGVMSWWKTDFERISQGGVDRRVGGPSLSHTGSLPTICPTCSMSIPGGNTFCPFCGSPQSREFEGSFPVPDYFDFEDALPDCAPMDAMPLSQSAPMPLMSVHACIADEPLYDTMDMAAPRMAMPTGAPASFSASAPTFGGRANRTSGPRSSAEPSAPTGSVSVRPWMPDADYLKALDKAAKDGLDKARGAYHAQRREYATSPSFFLDCAGWFMARDDTSFGLRVLSNLAEMRIEDAALLRVMAWRLREAGELEQALVVLRRVARLRGEDSQSYRDLALVLSELAREAYANADEAAARAYVEEAGELYRKTALTPWDRRPMSIGLFAVEEYNVLRAWAKDQTWEQAPELPSLGDEFEGVPDCDLRISLAWDADETDVDIHVSEPSGEEAYYAHRRTTSGGRVSEDITDGYGPELYEIRRAQNGIYKIRAHYYASHQQTVFGPATCTLTVYTNWGRSNQTQTITTTRLDREREMVDIGTAAYGEAAREEQATSEVDEVDASRRIELGMSVQQVSEILGEGTQEKSDFGREVWTWERPGGRKLVVTFLEGKVRVVTEEMPWGDDMTLLI